MIWAGLGLIAAIAIVVLWRSTRPALETPSTDVLPDRAPPSATPPEPAAPSAADLMRQMKQSSKKSPEWAQQIRVLKGLVLGASDRRRLWKRAHRGVADEHRDLEGILDPTPAEKTRLDDLVRELQRGR